ncbi:uncharacterized protein LOC113521070 [Galleria mellonella]|uniref:Uncharacterized protein LOC113521070 n=1 Tax=Galleria mellonella TaxID=7137 RepID=A0A6J1X729_GALME|nr:uncharacterized protein LOC113521070 [Galleria mellonella]
MDMPEVNKLFGIFPLKYGSYLISLFGLGSGGVGIAGIILYGIAENIIMAIFCGHTSIDEGIKKTVLMSIGLTSLLMLVANALLFLGVTFTIPGCVNSAVRVMLAMCVLIMLGAIILPVSCFFLSSMCLVKKISSVVMVLVVLTVTIFLELWLYFMVVAWNFEQTL